MNVRNPVYLLDLIDNREDDTGAGLFSIKQVFHKESSEQIELLKPYVKRFYVLHMFWASIWKSINWTISIQHYFGFTTNKNAIYNDYRSDYFLKWWYFFNLTMQHVFIVPYSPFFLNHDDQERKLQALYCILPITCKEYSDIPPDDCSTIILTPRGWQMYRCNEW